MLPLKKVCVCTLLIPQSSHLSCLFSSLLRPDFKLLAEGSVAMGIVDLGLLGPYPALNVLDLRPCEAIGTTTHRMPTGLEELLLRGKFISSMSILTAGLRCGVIVVEAIPG